VFIESKPHPTADKHGSTLISLIDLLILPPRTLGPQAPSPAHEIWPRALPPVSVFSRMIVEELGVGQTV